MYFRLLAAYLRWVLAWLTLNMEAMYSSETSILLLITQHYNLENTLLTVSGVENIVFSTVERSFTKI